MSLARTAIRGIVCALALQALVWAQSNALAAKGPVTEMAFHTVVPLGTEAFQLRDAHQTMYLLATAHDPHFEGWRRVMDAVGHRSLLDADGNRVLFFPETLNFRVTASTRVKLLDVEKWPALAGTDLNDYLLHLRFQLRIFHGLRQHIIKPAAAEMIGMPAEVAYDERVYRLSFNVGQLPMSDRVVLEVLSPKGERLSRFHLDLD